MMNHQLSQNESVGVRNTHSAQDSQDRRTRASARGKGYFTAGDTPSQNSSMTLYKCDTGVKFVSGLCFSFVDSLAGTFFLFRITTAAWFENLVPEQRSRLSLQKIQVFLVSSASDRTTENYRFWQPKKS